MAKLKVDYIAPPLGSMFVSMSKKCSGTLAFQIEGDYLGIAFSGLRGLSLYPAMSIVMGDAVVGLKYNGRVPVN